MAHTIKIDGTDYTIKGGKTKVDGTDYSIKGGKTKINGTDYSISFEKTITISGIDSRTLCYIVFNDDWANGVILQDGTYPFTDTDYIDVVVNAIKSADNSYCKIYLNNSVVYSGGGSYRLSNLSSYNTISISFTLMENRYFYAYITTI